METQFMGETEAKMATTHMIERDPATFHEIWHEAWREAWEASTRELCRVLRDEMDFAKGVIGSSDWIEEDDATLKRYERPA